MYDKNYFDMFMIMYRYRNVHATVTIGWRPLQGVV